MRFCSNCDNILIPKNKKLYCKACNEEFDLGSDQEEYKIQKKIHHDESELAPIVIKEVLRGERSSNSDRRGFEDYFSSSGSEGY